MGKAPVVPATGRRKCRHAYRVARGNAHQLVRAATAAAAQQREIRHSAAGMPLAGAGTCADRRFGAERRRE